MNNNVAWSNIPNYVAASVVIAALKDGKINMAAATLRKMDAGDNLESVFISIKYLIACKYHDFMD